MQESEQDNICELCQENLRCMQKQILSHTGCENFVPITLDEYIERDWFANIFLSIFYPACGSSNRRYCTILIETEAVSEPMKLY
ncbi:hypothetical protein ACFLXY_08875 [Chloroflexota bacterium]